MSFKSIVCSILACTTIVSLVGCTSAGTSSSSLSSSTAVIASSSSSSTADMSSSQAIAKLITDRSGNDISVPMQVNKIISMAPSVTETLIHLGLGDKLIGVDKHSQKVEGVPQGLPTFDIMKPDTENLALLKPEIIFATGMSKAKGDDPFKPITDLGVLMTYIPSSTSIDAIKEDIRFIGEVTNEDEKVEAIIKDMEKEFADILAKIEGKKVEKTVYFEIGAAPNLYSFGSDTFLNEMLGLLGAKNVLADQKSWVQVTEEAILALNPDVIMTNVDYVEDPVKEIMARNGWDALNAVKNKQVFMIDKNASSRSNEFIVKAFADIAKALYPEIYA